jgi:ribonuclease BN (tRNA processing enzyme)
MNSLIILGSGTCVPSLKRSCCSVLVNIGSEKLLLDCGTGTMRRLLEAGTEIAEISYILLSHFHPDHSAEVAPFLFSSKYAGKKRRTTPLTIIAGKGFSEFHTALKGVYGEWIDLAPELLNIIEMKTQSPDSLRFENFTLNTAPVNHQPESIAFRIEMSDRYSVVYSGDTSFSESLIALAAGADILICEASLPDELKVDVHLTPSLAGDIASSARVKKLILTHFYPECDDVDVVAQCRKTYSGHLILAEDLMRVEL